MTNESNLMKYDLFTGPELSERLAKEIQKSNKARLAVAFWGSGATERLNISKGAKIICNLTSGGTNPHEVRALIKAGAEVRQNNMLHAKIGWVDDLFSFVGSSNMSANGLGDEADAVAGWEESNVGFEGAEPSVKARFKALWKDATDISEECLKQAENAWRHRQRANQVTGGTANRADSLIEALITKPEHFMAHNTHVVIYETPTQDEQEIIDAATDEATGMYGDAFEVYWDWEELPTDAILLSFRIPASGQVAFEGVYKRDPNFVDFLKDGESFQVSYLLENLAGHVVGKREKQILRKAVSAYIKKEDGAYCFPVSELIPYIG